MAEMREVVRNVGWGDVAVRMPCPDQGEDGENAVARGDLDGQVGAWSRPCRPDRSGQIVVQRHPVRPASEPVTCAVDVAVAQMPRDPSPIPWAGVLSSLAAGAVVAMIFSPLFAILAAVSALGLIGRSLGSRWSYRRGLGRRSIELVSAEALVMAGAERWTALEQSRLRDDLVGPDALHASLAGGAYPWQQLDANELRVSVGRGAQTATPELELGTEDSDVADLVPPLVTMHDVPITTTVSRGEGLAITGDRAPAMAAARWTLLEQVVCLGPASLPVFLVTTADRLVEWDWAKWLPSLRGVAVGGGEAQELLAEVAANEATGLLVVDGVEPEAAGILAQVLSGTDTSHGVLWIGPVGQVPAVCTSAIATAPDGAARLTRNDEVQFVESAWGLSLDEALSWARGLAPFVDPLAADASSALPGRLGLAELSVDAPDVASPGAGDLGLEAAWEAASSHRLVATIGASEGGVVSLDLVADGPHALVAGTTGSGKSEFLRTLVTSLAMHQPPDLLSFLLVDFKGGGAFDQVSGLPHVAAVVTDLDGDEATRALTSMRAELKGREETLRRLGVGDVSDLGRTEAAQIPRLVLVVDEFATLADELPEFLDGLVDIARRGRSLGVHLVLATQRPAGVVTGQIRANTNMRVCLRVQDRNDSIDVIDKPDGSLLPAIPGRALIAIGADRPVPIQVATVNAASIVEGFEPFVLHPAIFGEDLVVAGAYAKTLAELNAVQQSRVADDRAESWVDDLAAMMCAATTTRASAPWLPSITEATVDDVRLLTSDAATDDVAMGVLDDPEHRRRLPFWWSSTTSGLLILGSDRDTVEHSVRLAVVGLLEHRRPVYIFDGLGGLDDFDAFCGVGAVLTPRAPEQAVKAVQLLSRLLRTGDDPPAVVIRGWSSVADALVAVGGADAALDLERLVREGLAVGAPVIVTGASDRDVPGRVRSRLATRLLHQLADPSSYAMFGLRQAPALNSPLSFVDPETGLVGVVASASRSRSEQARRLRPRSGTPAPVRVLGPTVSLSELPDVTCNGSTHRLALGLDEDLEVRSVELRPDRPLLVLGEPSEGRSAVVQQIGARLDASNPMVVDDAELVGRDEGVELVVNAAAESRPLVIAASPRSAKGFDSWIGKLLPDATVLLVNPTSRDGDVCRVVIPDLRDAPAGRSVIVDRGRVAVVQLAA